MLDKPISPLRQRMIDDMTARRFNEHTQMDYVRRVRSSAAFLGRSPDAATSEDVRRYQLQMAKEQSDKAGREKLPPPRSPRLRLSESHAPPTTPTERLLCRAFQQTLGLKEVSIDGDFFNEYGAHSLLMARFCARIRQLSPATRVAMRDVYANPNIRRLARAIDSAKLPTPPTRDIGPEHRPTLAAYYGCGLAQTVVYLLAGAIGVWIGNWASNGLTQRSILRPCSMDERSRSSRHASSAAIAVKWLLLWHARRQVIALWSLAYLRFWVVRLAVRSAPANVFAGGPIFNVYLRLLGARIGRNAVVASALVPIAADLFHVGDDAFVARTVVATGYCAFGGRLHLGAIRIGRSAFVGEASVLDIDAVIEDFGQLGHATRRCVTSSRVCSAFAWGAWFSTTDAL